MDAISTILVDGVLAFLLVAAITACFLVYRRLGAIKDGQAELRQLVDQLNNAVVEAQRSVGNLRQSAAEVEGRLQVQTRKASALADELGMITEAGNSLADRIEQGLTGAGAQSTSQLVDKTPKGSQKQQREILDALREAR